MTTPVVFRPDWGAPLVERYAWLTDVQTAFDGTETRTALRVAPRRTIRYRHLGVGHGARRLDAETFGWNGLTELAVPIWQDSQRIPATLASSSTTVSGISTANRDLVVGQYVLLTDGTDSELLVVDSLTSTSVTFTTGTSREWAAGSRLVPARAGRLAGVGRSYPTAGLVAGELAFDLTDHIDAVTAAGSASSFRGLDLDTRRPNRASPVDVEALRLGETIDGDVGRWVVDDQLGRPVASRSLEYVLTGRATIRGFLAWLHHLQGRAVAFWQPTFQEDLELVANIDALDTALKVRALSYAARYAFAQGRRTIAMWRKSTQTWHATRIANVLAGDPGVEEVYLDTMPAASTANDWVVSWLELVRLDADEVEVAYLSAEQARVVVGVREVVVE